MSNTETIQPPKHNCNSRLEQDDLLANCVHCGLCLEVCPTYLLTGDENNSPRGRLRLWRQEAEGKLDHDPWTDFYTAECVGCLACESACPANVPYGEILEHFRHEHVRDQRANPELQLQIASWLAMRQTLFNLVMAPARLLRRIGLLPHRFVPRGNPPLFGSTASYARKLMAKHQPTGPKVALLTGCLMESFFREINFATVRVLIENNVQVLVPENQGCCGAFQEHTGLGGIEQLREQNNRAFGELDVDAVVANSSGCGLALGKGLAGEQSVRDVLDFLGEIGPKPRKRRPAGPRVHVDLPCHLVHGQKVGGIADNVLDATGYEWQLAPNATDCCGSGGTYNIQKPENSQQILAKKASFLSQAAGEPVILATSNHVCMMQWNSARKSKTVGRDFEVKHVIQLLDPASE